MKAVILSVVAALGLASITDTVATEALYQPCSVCHGAHAEGRAELNAPALNGQSSDYLLRQLKHFSSGVRGSGSGDTYGAQMRGMASTLKSEAEMRQVAEYIASLPTTTSTEKARGDIRRGKNLYQGNCGACHGPKAAGNTALKAPRLAGLSATYLKRQFNLFKQGARGADPKDHYGKQMRLMAATLANEQDLQDVIAYCLTVAQQ